MAFLLIVLFLAFKRRNGFILFLNTDIVIFYHFIET